MGVTKATVDSALADVIDELYAAGLYSEKIADVEVYEDLVSCSLKMLVMVAI